MSEHLTDPELSAIEARCEAGRIPYSVKSDVDRLVSELRKARAALSGHADTVDHLRRAVAEVEKLRAQVDTFKETQAKYVLNTIEVEGQFKDFRAVISDALSMVREMEARGMRDMILSWAAWRTRADGVLKGFEDPVTNDRDSLRAQLDASRAALAEMTQAVGLATTAVPDLEMDPDDPLRMMNALVARVDSLRARTSDLEASIVFLQQERDSLRCVCGEAYQMAGALHASEKALDNLAAAASGRSLPHETFLPVAPGDCAWCDGAKAEVEKLRAQLAAAQADRQHYVDAHASVKGGLIDCRKQLAAVLTKRNLVELELAAAQAEVGRLRAVLVEIQQRIYRASSEVSAELCVGELLDSALRQPPRDEAT